MGGAVSAGHDNDDLIDNLLESHYITNPVVERVFRAVDRADYFLHETRGYAYKDSAWKSGNLHLSSPCIYSEVMEGLRLEPGQSFLNLGSGTGYLSTMAGLILGNDGINHGIEIYDEVVAYAIKKLDAFVKHSGAIDQYDFCAPKFVRGNCLCLNSGTRQYDRVYCGAACPEMHENYMKNLIRVGGILVMPINEQLLQITRTSDIAWDVKSLLPVSFATLIMPTDDNRDEVKLIDYEPETLQSICRTAIRKIMRENIEIENPDLKNKPKHHRALKKRTRGLRRLITPMYEGDSDDSTTEEDGEEDVDGEEVDVDEETNWHISIRQSGIGEMNSLLDLVLGGGNNEMAVDNAPEPEPLNAQIIEEEDEDVEEDEEVVVDPPEQRSVDDRNVEASNSKPPPNKREKFDSGLGDDDDDDDEVDKSSDSEDGELKKVERASGMEVELTRRNKRASNKGRINVRIGGKWRKVLLNNTNGLDYSSNGSSSESEAGGGEDGEASVVPNSQTLRMVSSPYTIHMRNKIKMLPLPHILKHYLNFYREL